MKLLGLNTLVEDIAYLKETLSNVEAENENLKKALAEMTEKVDEIEIPDFDPDDFVREDDVNDRIESYVNDNDIVTQSYVDDEIESKVDAAIENADIDFKVEEAIDDLDIEEKVRDLFNDASPAPMSEDDIKEEIQKAIAEVFSKVYDTLKRK